MEQEIIDFAATIGAKEPKEGDSTYDSFRTVFRERNYFIHKREFLIIKISRSEPPFYGLTKEIIDFLNVLNDYKLILLKSATQGWVLSKEEINQNIKSKRWNLDSTGKQYKINKPSLPDSNFFLGPKGCLKRL